MGKKTSTSAPAQEEKVSVDDKNVVEQSEQSSILIVDDEEPIRELIGEIISDLGYKTEFAIDGQQALDCMRSKPIDLVVSDIRMPNMDGTTFVEKLREINKRVPIILVTGNAKQSDLVRLINSHVEGLIEKPFEGEELAIKVKSCLRLKKMKDALVTMSTLNYQAYMQIVKMMQKVPSSSKLAG